MVDCLHEETARVAKSLRAVRVPGAVVEEGVAFPDGDLEALLCGKGVDRAKGKVLGLALLIEPVGEAGVEELAGDDAGGKGAVWGGGGVWAEGDVLVADQVEGAGRDEVVVLDGRAVDDRVEGNVGSGEEGDCVGGCIAGGVVGACADGVDAVEFLEGVCVFGALVVGE